MSALIMTPELTRYISLLFMWCLWDGLSPCFHFVRDVLYGLAQPKSYLLRASARPGAPSPPFGPPCSGWPVGVFLLVRFVPFFLVRGVARIETKSFCCLQHWLKPLFGATINRSVVELSSPEKPNHSSEGFAVRHFC